MRRFCCLLLCLLLTLSLVPARTEALEVSAAAAVLMDADTGEILFEKNADLDLAVILLLDTKGNRTLHTI